MVSKGPQKKQKRTFDASLGTTPNDEDFGCPDALDTQIRPDDNKRVKERLRKVRDSASDALAPKLSLEIVWAQKLEKAEVKQAAKNAHYARAFELQEKQIAMQERRMLNEERERLMANQVRERQMKIQEREMAQKQFELEEKIMAMDTSAMSGAQQQYYMNKKNDIAGCL
ncbi:hypothetical protein ZWY2020_012724 [Hordeum vulgare]|nr:hypothetical protein ZWY2020_012724 [Hordeum vulgare]